MSSTSTTQALTLRRLNDDAPTRAELQRVHDASADFLHLISGLAPGADDVDGFFKDLPPGKGYDDKFCLGIYSAAGDGERMVGCADLIRGFPDVHTAYIGLLLLEPAARGHGLGRAAFEALEAQARSWPGIRSLRLGVVATTPVAQAFWVRMGFAPTGIVKPHRLGIVESTVAVYVKQLMEPPR